MKNYQIPEKVTCKLLDVKPRLRPVAKKFTRQLEDMLSNIDAAVAENSFDEIRKFAYWLKAAGGSVGYGEFTDPATDLEAGAKAKDMEVIKHTIGVIKEIQLRMESLETESQDVTESHVKLVSK